MSDLENQRLTERMHRLGEQPVDSDLAGRHLTAMMTLPRPERASRFHRAKVAAAFATGLVLGGTSLASAGALGDGVQRTVADTVDGVGIDLPGGTPRSTEGCEGQEIRTHGQFVSGGGDPHSDCGKPVASLGEKPEAEPEDEGASPAAPACRPPWAGRGNAAEKTPEARAAHRAACGGSPEPGTVEDDTEDADGADKTAEGNGAANGKGASNGKSAEKGMSPAKGKDPSPRVSTPQAPAADEPEAPPATEADPPTAEQQVAPPADDEDTPPATDDPVGPADDVAPPSEPGSDTEAD